ncbi:nucleotidyltransferase domain-containing protein [Psychrobacter sp. LV10R520-6]|uniref:nucleotidyltransferase domain-containing protein n=1 Tax=Psychrobacter sp. LV10R520-6 TaxID=1415574 RepID=UPI0024C8790F|nr:nucleotidyltransferase domain-containing protein [Psychrobacter sp. LV10R520-6]SNT70276.1 Nucleotidyltransferase domain-containing protein [Psychrobacter sp. LV10R520-6]
MHIKLPKGTSVYVFGSYLNTDFPNDLDILCLYNPYSCHPKYVFKKYQSMIKYLESFSGLKVDITFLTYKEEIESGFLAMSNAVPVVKCKKLAGIQWINKK